MGIKIVLPPISIEFPCEMSSQRDSVLFFHWLQQDNIVSPLKIQWAWISSEEMDSTQLHSIPSVSPPQLFCFLQQLNEFHP